MSCSNNSPFIKGLVVIFNSSAPPPSIILVANAVSMGWMPLHFPKTSWGHTAELMDRVQLCSMPWSFSSFHFMQSKSRGVSLFLGLYMQLQVSATTPSLTPEG